MTAKRVQLFALANADRQNLRTPFPVEWRGAEWDCVTNGHAMLMIRDATWPRAEEAPDVTKVLTGYDLAKGGRVEGLLDWCFGATRHCTTCAGSGSVEDDTGEWLCGCDNGLPGVQVGEVGGVLFNRRIVYRFLTVGNVYAPSEHHEVRWVGMAAPLFVETPDARMVLTVMPLRGDCGDTPEPLEVIGTRRTKTETQKGDAA